MKLFRSYLFVPARKIEIIKKAVLSDADCVIIDLEDAVALSEKDRAREIAKEALLQFATTKPIFVRINDMTTLFWEKDLSCAIENGAFGVIIPKSEKAERLKEAGDIIRKCGKKIQIIPLIETAKGAQFCFEIAKSDTLISRLAFGYIDFALDIGCDLTPEGIELLYTRSKLVIASRAAEIAPPIDAVYPHISNPEGLQSETKHAKQVGFKAKLTIHPKQLEMVHQILTPTSEEIEESELIVKEFEEAEKNGIASIMVNGKLVDYPIYQRAKVVLQTI